MKPTASTPTCNIEMTAHIALSFLQCCLCRILRLAGWAEVSRLYLTCHREAKPAKGLGFPGMVLSVSHALYHDAVMMPLLQHHRARTYSPGWKRPTLVSFSRRVRVDFCFVAQVSEAAKLGAKSGIFLDRIG